MKAPKKKVSTVKRGNYYKKKTQKWFEEKGYTVELTEFVCGRPIGDNKIIYMKKDILASDGIAYNEKEFILWNSKHTDTGSISDQKSKGKKAFEEIKTPPFIEKQLIIWQPRVKQPEVIIITET